MAMAANWHPSMGFEVPTLCLFCGVTFTFLLGNPITDKDTVVIDVRVLNRMGLFLEEYKTWIPLGNNASKTNNFVPFKAFWEKAVQITAFTAVPASQNGYGMAATNNNALLDIPSHLWREGISNLGMEFLSRNTPSNLAGTH